MIKVHPGIEIEFTDDQIRARIEARTLVEDCKKQADAKNETANDTAVVDGLIGCVELAIAATIAKANEELNFQNRIRKRIAAKMENYTCANSKENTSAPVDTDYWLSEKDNAYYAVQIMLNRPASRIHVIENFITQEECDAMEEAARPRLHRATVADGKGGSHYSEHRKAMQAAIKVPWYMEKEGNPIARLSRRVYDYADRVLGLGIKENGQEDLMSIQYFGRGENDTAPDRYMPHCDSECIGTPHKIGNRIATMVMYW